jgi:hypothetical protein
MYTSDPQNRLLYILTEAGHIYIISTRTFFNLDGRAAAMPVPWECWGPSNTRIFAHRNECKVRVCGNRVLKATPFGISGGLPQFFLQMMDFSPLAVTNRRDLGRVVKEPSTIVMHSDDWSDRPVEILTTSLSYVEVELNRRFGSSDSGLVNVWVDHDRVYLLNSKYNYEQYYNIRIAHSEIQVIDV